MAKIRYQKWFFHTMKNTIVRGILSKFNIHYTDIDPVQDIKPPYLVMPNHIGFWDPFIINFHLKYPIHYVVSDSNFRDPLRAFGLSLVGSIPKTKSVSDYESVKNILSVKNRGGVIGIFPEGKRNWDGATLPIFYSAAKLIKKFQLPVIVPLLKGMFFCNPRWGKKKRIGKIEVEFRTLFMPEQIVKLSVDEIFTKLKAALYENDYDFQREKMIPYKGKKIAENVEEAVYVCPHCRSIGHLRSQDDRVFCGDCGWTVRMNEYGFFVSDGYKVYFDNLHDWNVWQTELIHKMVVDYKKKKRPGSILRDRRGILFTGFKRKPMKKFRVGSLTLFYDRLLFVTLFKRPVLFDIRKIRGINVQDNEKLEFYYDDILYRLHFPEFVSTYKWATAILLLQQEWGVETEQVI